MTNNDEYNGWTNRETWALNLWLTNDQGLYEMTCERVANAVAYALSQNYDLAADRVAGEAIESALADMFDVSQQLMAPENIITILSDVGSLHRVNWDELGSSFLDELPDPDISGSMT